MRKSHLWLTISIIALVLIGLFIGAKYANPNLLRNLGSTLPLPAFTALIALIDGFNPCNLFVIALLLGFIISASESKAKVYTVGITFIIVVYMFYFLFMATWLNIFKYIGFIDPLLIVIAIIAIVAGLINCKELFFFKQGPSLTIRDEHKGLLYKRVRKLKDTLEKGSIPLLILASISLAVFASLIELPCTAGFPIIYTGVLASKVMENSLQHYIYLAFYNLIYVLPLIVIVGCFGFSLRSKQISQKQVQIIKFIGGFIMLVIGVILLVAPQLIT